MELFNDGTILVYFASCDVPILNIIQLPPVVKPGHLCRK